MVRQTPDSAAMKELLGAGVAGVLVAKGTGTTNAVINTAALVSHGARDKDGNAFPAANLFVLALPTSSAGGLYEGAATTATQIDIRSPVASVPYRWFLFVIN